MTGSDRRADIIQQIKESRTPVSGTKLALRYEVSRQVIVQDIALIRASGYDIISTNRGYILNAPKSVSRDFKVQHTDCLLYTSLLYKANAYSSGGGDFSPPP